MIEIKCPRCEQYWYANEKKRGRARLCEHCAKHVRRKREGHGEIDFLFLIIAGVLLFVDLFTIILAALDPEVFARVLLVYGGIQFVGGMIALRGFRWERGFGGWFYSGWFDSYEYFIDWHFGRWPLLFAISGIFCALISFVWLRK